MNGCCLSVGVSATVRLYTSHFALYTPNSALYTPHSTCYTQHPYTYTSHSTLQSLPWCGNRGTSTILLEYVAISCFSRMWCAFGFAGSIKFFGNFLIFFLVFSIVFPCVLWVPSFSTWSKRRIVSAVCGELNGAPITGHLRGTNSSNAHVSKGLLCNPWTRGVSLVEPAEGCPWAHFRIRLHVENAAEIGEVVTGRIVTVDGRWKTRNSHGLILQILVGNQTWLGGKSTIIGYNWRIMEVLHNGKS